MVKQGINRAKPLRALLALDLSQLVEIEHAIAHDRRPGVRRRAAAIRLLHLGHTPRQSAVRLGCKPTTVRLWRQRFYAEGVAGLADRPRSGRPRKGGAHYQTVLEEALAHDPDELGYPFRAWTVQRLREHLALKTGITLSDGRMRALLQRLGYRYQRYIRRTPGWLMQTRRGPIYLDRLEPFWTWKR